MTAWVALAFGGCSLAREGTLRQNCTAASACDDQNPCTVDTCSAAGLCEYVADADQVLADALQVAGDCQRLVCVAGALIGSPDDTDIADDDNGCTVDGCDSSGVIHTPLAPDDACVDPLGHPGVCVLAPADPAGVVCAAACTISDQSACDDDNDCTEDSCDVAHGVCYHAPLNGTAAPQQTPGDCQLLLCSGGDPTPVADDSDLPTAPNDCASASCNEGTVVITPAPIGTNCENGRVCNGDPVAPACVSCNFPSDCASLPPDDECQKRACNAGSCAQTFTTVDTPVAVQTPGDCKLRVCDGAGAQKDDVLTSDVPVDGNDCTDDLCDGQGNPQNPILPPNSPCGVNGTCTAAGVCGCTTVAQCPADGYCRTWACTAGLCVASAAHVGQALPTPAQFPADPTQTPNDCQELRCSAQGAVASIAVNDPPAADGNDCTLEACNGGVPSVTPAPLDTVCPTQRYCDGAGQCVACNQTSQCDATGCACRVCSANNCSTVNASTLAACQVAGDCKSNYCDGAGATTSSANVLDLPDDGNQCTLDLCALNGTPSNPAAPAGTLCSQNGGQVCDGAKHCYECISDLYCNLLTETCDTGSHTCKTKQGQGCSSDLDCKSGHCTDGVCCDKACGGLCEACNLFLSVGTCANLPTDQTPDAECNDPTLTCKAGACKRINGTVCGGGGDCASGFCPGDDHVCCDSACTVDCFACVQSKTGAADGNCSLVTTGTDPDNDCSGHKCCTLGLCVGSAC